MEATLDQILEAREQRAARQRHLLDTYGEPLICFTMNIPGPEKNSRLIGKVFRIGLELLEAQLSVSAMSICGREVLDRNTGCEAYLSVHAQPDALKKLCCQIEDLTPGGRLFDMDVVLPDGSKYSREDIGQPGRSCMICGGPVYACSRSRAHSLKQLQEKTATLLRETLWHHGSRQIGAAAQKALLYEVCITPKPGLVDLNNSGSHRDMDLFTFLSSCSALQPYFTDCARMGMETAQLSESTVFDRLRFRGKQAEQEMLAATGGINTHKGAVFSLGLLCAAAGRIWEDDPSPDAVCTQAAVLAQGIVARDMNGSIPMTAGQRLYQAHGITGVRGQAEAGFPAVLNTGLPILEEGLARGLSINDAGTAALLHILVSIRDTNLIARSDVATQEAIREKIAGLLADNPFPSRQTLEALDAAFISKNLSPGGSADLLAASLFLHFLQKQHSL